MIEIYIHVAVHRDKLRN